MIKKLSNNQKLSAYAFTVELILDRIIHEFPKEPTPSTIRMLIRSIKRMRERIDKIHDLCRTTPIPPSKHPVKLD